MHQQIETYKTNADLTEAARTQMIDTAKNTYNQSIEIATEGYKAGREQVDAAVYDDIGLFRSTYYTYQCLGIGLILSFFGGFLTFRPRRQ